MAALWEMLRAWLRALLGKSHGAAREAVRVTRHRILGPQYPPDPVRRLYAQMLRRAQAAGVPRPPFSTPGEFQLSMATRWPAGSADFAALTEAYVLRRYGEVSFDDRQVQELTERWHRLRSVMRRPVRQAPAVEQQDGAQPLPKSWEPVPSGPASAQLSRLARLRLLLSWDVLVRWMRGAGLRVLFGILLLLAPLIVLILLATVIWHG
jgi:hypothetical protein